MFLIDADATHKAGRALSSVLHAGDVIALSGDLEEEAPSPSFALVIPYEPPETRIPVWHVDLYRLDGPAQAEELGLDEAHDHALMLIEWPERLENRLWPAALWLRFEQEESGRRLTASLPPSWEARWPFR
jgi:tRNA threonylcarbamoyladenosine biosynthesis protein TsaE